MARLTAANARMGGESDGNSNSDSEAAVFPALTDLRRTRPAAGRARMGTGTKMASRTDPDLGGEGVREREGRGRGLVEGRLEAGRSARGDVKESPAIVGKSGRKKRVLGPRSDNPLLRPMGKVAREGRVREASVGVGSKEGAMGRAGRGAKVVGRRTVTVRILEEVEGTGEGDDSDLFGNRKGSSTKPLPASRMAAKSKVLNSESLRLSQMEAGRLVRAPQSLANIEITRNSSIEKVASQSSIDVPKIRESEQLDESDEAEEVGFEFESDESRDEGEETGDETLPESKPKKPLNGTQRDKPSHTVINLDSDDESLGGLEESQAPRPKPQRSRNHMKLAPKSKSRFILTDTEAEDSPEEEDSDGMSDFIVSDNEPLDEEDDDSVFEVPPPATRSARKLFRGRRPRIEESDDELDLRMDKLKVDDGDVFETLRERKLSREENNAPRMRVPLTNSQKVPFKGKAILDPLTKKKEVPAPPSSDVENLFTIRFSPSEHKRKASKESRFTTPPGSPKLKPRVLPSPSKLPRIPTSPHRQSSDAFWAQDVVNDWNDEYSPRKPPAPTLKPITTADGTLLFSPRKSPIKPDRLTKDAKKTFSQIKHGLAESFLKELDDKITLGKIAELAATTGGVKIIWSKKLNTTAGRANWKRETIRQKSTNPSEPAATIFRHHANIELAEKVIDDRDRLLNVIAHEFCHLANFMVSNVRTNPHGKEFKAWASKVSAAFGNRGIEVTTKHSYEIEYKYVWECENCGTEFKRHSKSIDVSKHRCGVCKSLLVQTRPVPRAGAKEKGGGLTAYQAFVQENMKKIKDENPGSPQKVVMALVGKKYQEFKAGQLREGSVESISGSGIGLVESKEGTPVDDGDVGAVVRKLDFLDLTSP